MKIDDVANIQMSKLIHFCGGIIINLNRITTWLKFRISMAKFELLET
jgi:hypothetical protein